MVRWARWKNRGYNANMRQAALNQSLKKAAEKKGAPLTDKEARDVVKKHNREWEQHHGDSYRGDDSSGGTSWRW